MYLQNHPQMCIAECLARCQSLPSMALLIQMAFQKPYLVQMGVKFFSTFFLGICIPLQSKMSCRSCSWLHFKFVNQHCQGNLSVWSANGWNGPAQWKYKPFLTFRCNEVPSAIGKLLIHDYVAWMIVKVKVHTDHGI